MPAEPERRTYVLTIDFNHLGERTASAAYILTLKVSYDCRPAPQHVMSWHLGQIGRVAAHMAGAPMTVAYGPADHAYEVAASAKGPVGRGGRSRPIASFGLFRAITGGPEGVNPSRWIAPHVSCLAPHLTLGSKTRSGPVLMLGGGAISAIFIHLLGLRSSSRVTPCAGGQLR